MRLYARLEHSRQPLAPRSLFAKRVAFNFAIALAVILASLFAGMLGYRYFEGFYALYSGLLLIGVTGLILAPVFHRVMHLCHLPVENGGSPKPTHRSGGAKPGR